MECLLSYSDARHGTAAGRKDMVVLSSCIALTGSLTRPVLAQTLRVLPAGCITCTGATYTYRAIVGACACSLEACPARTWTSLHAPTAGAVSSQWASEHRRARSGCRGPQAAAPYQRAVLGRQHNGPRGGQGRVLRCMLQLAGREGGTEGLRLCCTDTVPAAASWAAWRRWALFQMHVAATL
jgi:hypothetical protein